MKYFAIYLFVLNIVTYVLYGVDKNLAIQQKRRISEKTLLTLPILGGSIGGILGMFIFHHKTKHWYFRYGLPLILLIQIVIIVLVYIK